jgi:ribonuclease J
MMLMEYHTPNSVESIIIDTGIMFPENDMLGVDYIIPDFKYIMDKLDTIKGVIITHGHEDHTGAIAHVMEYVNAPVYATPLTRGLLEVKLKNARLLDKVKMITVNAGDNVQIGPFGVEFFHVCHSIPDSVGLGITTPVGLIVHTGDFKFDHTPVDGKPSDFAKLAEFSSRGVLALFSDSTNATTRGWTASEKIVDEAFDKVFHNAKGRIMVATFASLISRIQQVANCAVRYNRKLAVVGFSMVENVKMARELGYLNFPAGLQIDIGDAHRYPSDQVVIMTTGAQGEPAAGLGRLAAGEHRQLEVEEGDTIVLSSHPIPGNEEMVSRTINRLLQRGAQVIYDPIERVHVSGHASQEELKLMINMIRPRFFIPVHGELRHLYMHRSMAVELGVPFENTAVIENGTMIDLSANSMTVGERVKGGYVYVDGSGVGDVGPAVLRDRELLARDGFVIVNLSVDSMTGEMVDKPEIISRGFVYLPEANDLMVGALRVIETALINERSGRAADLQDATERALEKHFYNETRRRPMVFVLVHDLVR